MRAAKNIFANIDKVSILIYAIANTVWVGKYLCFTIQ